jgi:hypothetical protein
MPALSSLSPQTAVGTSRVASGETSTTTVTGSCRVSTAPEKLMAEEKSPGWRAA